MTSSGNEPQHEPSESDRTPKLADLQAKSTGESIVKTANLDETNSGEKHSEAAPDERSNARYEQATSQRPASIWKILLTGVLIVVGGFFALGFLLLGTCFLGSR
jgi:hypothetical protein